MPASTTAINRLAIFDLVESRGLKNTAAASR